MHKSINILVIEDDPEDFELLKHTLDNASIYYTAKRVDKEPEFCRELKQNIPDIVISDYSLPKFDPFTALEILKEYSQDTPFILLSGTISEDVARDCIRSGMNDCIKKMDISDLPNSIIDVIYKKESEKIIRKKEEHYKRLIENVTDIIAIIGNDLKIHYISPSVTKVLGYTPEELIHKNLLQYLYSEDSINVKESLMELKTEMEVSGIIEVRCKHKDGSWRFIEATGKVFTDDFDFPCFIINGRDITERKKLQQQLEEKIKELDIFIYRASHDLKGPLSSVQGIINLAKKEVTNPTSLEYFDLIEKSNERLSAIVKGLIDLTMVSERTTQKDNIDMEVLIKDIIQSLENIPKSEKIQFDLKVKMKKNFYGDHWLLSSILQNLIHNAIKYRQETKDPFIKIEVSEINNYMSIIITDNGIGMPKETSEKVFNMYFRGSEKSDGSGLGLYIVKNAVSKMNGNIQVKSIEGKGTTFSIELPIDILPATIDIT